MIKRIRKMTAPYEPSLGLTTHLMGRGLRLFHAVVFGCVGVLVPVLLTACGASAPATTAPPDSTCALTFGLLTPGDLGGFVEVFPPSTYVRKPGPSPVPGTDGAFRGSGQEVMVAAAVLSADVLAAQRSWDSANGYASPFKALPNIPLKGGPAVSDGPTVLEIAQHNLSYTTAGSAGAAVKGGSYGSGTRPVPGLGDQAYISSLLLGPDAATSERMVTMLVQVDTVYIKLDVGEGPKGTEDDALSLARLAIAQAKNACNGHL